MEIAARCGAQCVRVIAGEASDSEAVQVSAANLRAFASFGRTLGIGVLTENFRALGTSVGALNAVLDLCEGEVGLCADFGNFQGPDKYRDLAAILPRATSVHAKADFPAVGQMDREDFVRCLRLASDAEFAGPYSLIFSSRGDEWEGIEKTREVVEEWL
jgi:sugar phosphate isomerase/epimerase